MSDWLSDTAVITTILSVSGVPVSVVLGVLALEMRDILIAAKQSDPNIPAASQASPRPLRPATC